MYFKDRQTGELVKAVYFHKDGSFTDPDYLEKVNAALDVLIDDGNGFISFDPSTEENFVYTSQNGEINLKDDSWVVNHPEAGKFVVNSDVFAELYEPFLAQKKKVCFLLNGPANSGKDTLAVALSKVFGEGEIKAFKDSLYEKTAEYFGVALDVMIKLATDRVTKEVSNELFKIQSNSKYPWYLKWLFWLLGRTLQESLSPRQALIHVSENIIKPQFGKQFFGESLANKINASEATYTFVPDSGFLEEMQALVNEGFIVNVIRIHRNGLTFDGDSRRYLTDDELDAAGVGYADFNNDGKLEDLVTDLAKFIGEKAAEGKFRI